jgi:hypothetical protein
MKRTGLVFLIPFFVLVLAVGTLPALAEEKEFEPGIKLITTTELKSLLDGKSDLVLIDNLSPIEFRDKSIPGSINLPYEWLEAGKVALPADKERMVVFYCMGFK